MTAHEESYAYDSWLIAQEADEARWQKVTIWRVSDPTPEGGGLQEPRC